VALVSLWASRNQGEAVPSVDLSLNASAFSCQPSGFSFKPRSAFVRSQLLHQRRQHTLDLRHVVAVRSLS
jgi:hypothetical protein